MSERCFEPKPSNPSQNKSSSFVGLADRCGVVIHWLFDNYHMGRDMKLQLNAKVISTVLASALLLLLTSCLSGGGGGNDGTTSSSGPSAGGCTSATYAAPSGAANNIVFTFDKAYTCGQFANGDWWVSTDSSGFVTITSITPTASGGSNGFQVNPSITNKQAFEATAEIPYDASLLPSLPLKLAGVSSVVKAVSVPAPVVGGPEPHLQFAAVLTIVNAPVINSAEVFRPGYFGATKTFYSATSINVAGLPKYAATGLPSVAGFPISGIATRYQRVQLDHFNDYRGRDMHPADNMPDYGADIARDSGVNLLRMLLSDFNYSNATHKQALINYLQMAVDLQTMAAGGVKWPGDGGHLSGRKLPLIFAAWAFSNTDFSNAIAASVFAEDVQVWRNSGGIALFGLPQTEAEYWSDIRGLGGSKDVRDPYGYIDGGSQGPGELYQFCCTSLPWKYTTLALYMLNLKAAWGNGDILVDYVERWVSSGAKALPDACAPYDGIPANYGFTYGPDPLNPGQCIAGAGRFPAKNGINANGGFYGNTFGDELWLWYKACGC
jgi:hypothetical protein